MKMIQSPNYKTTELTGKKILIGVTGSIAAYKIGTLIRLLIKSGADVQVIMTPAATDFVSTLTFSTLSKNPVYTEFKKGKTGEWNNHVELGLNSDLMVIAPATANTLSKMANGLCDNLLLATFLSARCDVFVSPAMDLDMLKHPTTQNNLKNLRQMGISIIKSGHGELASGLIGDGRMAEPEEIFESIRSHFSASGSLLGKKVLVTAGPTQESIDPVRYISNHSTGKMGYAIANEFKKRGCEVVLVTGPTSIEKPDVDEVKNVTTADEMFNEAESQFANSDIVVLTAAVADYAPEKTETKKIKKKSNNISLELKSTVDIAKTLGQSKHNQFIVGFALETNNELENARKKLESKNFDAIVLNSLSDESAGFGHDTNKITIINKDNKVEYPLKNKNEVASDIVDYIENNINGI